MKNSFVLFNDLIDTVSILKDEDAGVLFKMILNYENGRELTQDIKCESMPALIAFTFVKRQLNRLDEQYEKTTQARIEAGRKGAEARWHSKAIANNGKAIASDSKAMANDSNNMAKMPINVPVPVPVNNISPLPPKGEPPETVINNSELSDPVKSMLKDWVQYKRERREGYKPAGLKSLVTTATRYEKNVGADAVCEVIRKSMSSGYKGIVWDRLDNRAPVKTNQFNNYSQNSYDFDALEKELIQN